MVINVDRSQEGHHLKREGVLIKMRAGKEDAPLFPFDRIPASAVLLLLPHGPCQPVHVPCSWEMVKDPGRQLGGMGAGTPWEQCFPLLPDGAGQTVPLFRHIVLGLKQWVPAPASPAGQAQHLCPHLLILLLLALVALCQPSLPSWSVGQPSELHSLACCRQRGSVNVVPSGQLDVFL